MSPASDIYSMGAVLFEALTGRSYLPEAGRRADVESAIMQVLPALPEDVHPRLGAIALRALEKDPRERYASASEMREAIERLRLV